MRYRMMSEGRPVLQGSGGALSIATFVPVCAWSQPFCSLDGGAACGGVRYSFSGRWFHSHAASNSKKQLADKEH
jgi:hypothetical protein